MVRRSGLGKGLSSLIPPGAESVTGGDSTVAILVEIPLADISPNPHQPRVHFDEETLAELANSIAQIGVLQPILVRPGSEGAGYELIAGERRWRAAGRAGLATIPAVIRPSDDQGSVEQALVENLHRQDLTPLEEAAAYQQLIEDFGLTHEQMAERVGKSRSAITNTVRLLNLAAPIQALLSDGMLSAGAARALLGVDDQAAAVSIAEKAAAEGWSVRQVEDAARSLRDEPDAEATGGSPATVAAARPAQIIALEERLSDRLGAPVRISYGRGGGGRLTVRFGSVDDLERIYRGLLGAVDA
jgi:ParB family transcriptional regulator, chromosome partitioning protein